MTRTRVVAASVLMACMLAACGSSTKVVQPNVNVSIGQQLIDLKHARDSGALSESEYQKQKQQLIKNFHG